MKTIYIEVAGVPTRYVDLGAGPPLLFLPPSAFLLAPTYRRVFHGLAGQYRVLAPEQPGTGRSSPLGATWSIERYADWSVDFLDALGIERAVVAGHSTGGGFALAMAAMYPERIERLILVDTVGVTLGRSPARLVASRAIDAFWELRLDLTAWPDTLSNLLRHRGRFFGQIALATEADLRHHAARVSAPTLLAWGVKDAIFPLACARVLKSLIPHATMCLSPTGSHDWLLMEPDRFVRAVLDWLATTAEATAPPDRSSAVAAGSRRPGT